MNVITQFKDKFFFVDEDMSHCHTWEVVTRQPGHCDERARPVTASLWAERVHTGLESFLTMIVMIVIRGHVSCHPPEVHTDHLALVCGGQQPVGVEVIPDHSLHLAPLAHAPLLVLTHCPAVKHPDIGVTCARHKGVMVKWVP